MALKTAIVALTLVLSPALAQAMGGCSSHDEQAQSCAPGTAWDAETQGCVKIVNS